MPDHDSDIGNLRAQLAKAQRGQATERAGREKFEARCSALDAELDCINMDKKLTIEVDLYRILSRVIGEAVERTAWRAYKYTDQAITEDTFMSRVSDELENNFFMAFDELVGGV